MSSPALNRTIFRGQRVRVRGQRSEVGSASGRWQVVSGRWYVLSPASESEQVGSRKSEARRLVGPQVRGGPGASAPAGARAGNHRCRTAGPRGSGGIRPRRRPRRKSSLSDRRSEGVRGHPPPPAPAPEIIVVGAGPRGYGGIRPRRRPRRKSSLSDRRSEGVRGHPPPPAPAPEIIV